MNAAPAPAPPANQAEPARPASEGAKPDAKPESAAKRPAASAEVPKPPAPGDFSELPGEETADRTLPDEAIHALYSLSRSELSGPTAFGARSTAIGVVNLHGRTPPAKGSRTAVMDAGILGESSDTYVSTTSDSGLDLALHDRGVVYLSGPVGTGRSTTACVALARRHGLDRVAQILPALDIHLIELIDQRDLLLKGHGHLLAGDGLQLDMTQLAILNRKAEQAGASVVIIGRAGRHDTELSRFLVRHVGPEPATVFSRWLRHRIARSGTCVGDCVEDTGACHGQCVEPYVATCLDQCVAYLRGTPPLDGLVHAATVFAQDRPGSEWNAADLVAQAGISLRSQAGDLLRAGADHGVLGSNRLLHHQQAFRIAYAVLNGRSLTHVFSATGELLDLLDDARNIPRTGRTVLELDINALLPDRERSEATTDARPIASGTARTAQLRDPRLIDALLDVLWNDYDSVRTPLLIWLTNLVHHRDPLVRVAAAATAGRLCGYDLDEVVEAVIGPWATSRVQSHRQAAALALESAAHNEHLTATIGRRVHSWVTGVVSGAVLRDTAARAYATPLGQWFTEYALPDLTIIARDPVQVRSGSVARAIEQIYRPEYAAAVMDTISSWLASELPLLRGHADRCLIALARHPADAPRQAWPQLLAHAAEGLISSADLTPLWRSALRHPWTSAAAWEALRYWIACAGSEPALAASLAELVRDILDAPALRARARFYRERIWRTQLPSNSFLPQLDRIIEER